MGVVSKPVQRVSKFFTMIRSQHGQAAIFVALMFNVLFVFFAMAINVALVVNDKINLQNSLDLATYYAASKQAEILNVIAHENYAIRQSYKLLAWRYRVLGQMGLDRTAQKHPVWINDTSDTPFPPGERPSFCMVYKPTWQEVPENENLCNTENLRIPPLPEVQVIFGTSLNAGIAALSRQLRMQFDRRCEMMGAFNWWFAMSSLHAFRLDQRNRKQIMYALARNLSTADDFIDLDGNSVLEGAKQTLLKNLTWANRQAFEGAGGEFKMFNSLGGLDPKQWLVEVQIAPTVLYHDPDESGGCNAFVQPVQNLPKRPDAQRFLQQPFPQGLAAGNLFEWRTDGVLRDSDYQFSIGVEKNPWYMAYIGIRAKTLPRQIFFPLGAGVEMIARSFAKPFGGRIGPWYSAHWNAGGQTSDGRPTDSLMAPRYLSGLELSANDPRRLPNYSRYPGDTLGLQSRLALNALTDMNRLQISFDHYKNIKEDLAVGAPNDILPWDAINNKEPEIRNYELAAIAPDLFDITYYSIEPNFAMNYYPKLRANRTRLQIPSDVPIRTDLGSQGTAIETYTIQQQMALAKTKNLQRPEAFYFVREKPHLLTSWLPGPGAFNYETQESLTNFGKCSLPDDNFKYKNPGSCVAGGGRVGYSVKLISRDALLSKMHRIGGEASTPDGILNPPPADQGF